VDPEPLGTLGGLGGWISVPWDSGEGSG